MKEWGKPPALDDCAEVPLPDGVKLRADHALLKPVAQTGMVPRALKTPLPVNAIVRQLIVAYARDIEVGPVAVKVPGIGTVCISTTGWCVV